MAYTLSFLKPHPPAPSRDSQRVYSSRTGGGRPQGPRPQGPRPQVASPAASEDPCGCHAEATALFFLFLLLNSAASRSVIPVRTFRNWNY